MQFLCLHGALSNSYNFGIQLAPLEKDLEQDRAASFRFLNATILTDPLSGFEKYFGIGPWYSWIRDSAVGSDRVEERIRDMPVGNSPEDVMRKLIADIPVGASETLKANIGAALESIYRTLEENPEIEGVIGYSEGACLAATLVLDEIRRQQDAGQARRIKCAMFITGWPPYGVDADIVLSDTSALRIDVPTLHVIGANDPYKNGALALFSICDENKATLFDTAKGHTIPREGQVIRELGVAVRDLISST